MTLYETLGVTPDADDAAITSAYRRAAKRHHPDAGGDPAHFAQLSRAVAVLRDPDRRARYDATGETDQPDTGRGPVIELLTQAFSQALTEAQDITRTDIIGQAKAILGNQMSALKANRSGAKSHKADIKRALKRLSHKGDGPNFLGLVLDAQLAAIEKALAEMERVEALLKAAMELAGEFGWQVDATPVQTAMWSTTATGAGWG